MATKKQRGRSRGNEKAGGKGRKSPAQGGRPQNRQEDSGNQAQEEVAFPWSAFRDADARMDEMEWRVANGFSVPNRMVCPFRGD